MMEKYSYFNVSEYGEYLFTDCVEWKQLNSSWVRVGITINVDK